MKSSDLRIGNFVSVCYEDTLIAEEVIILEPGTVHLSNRKYADSDRDIVGVPLSEEWLMRFRFSYNAIRNRWYFNDLVIKRSSDTSNEYWVLQFKCGKIKIAFVHELQNLLHVLNRLD